LNDRDDRDELLDILKDAVVARNGWKRILTYCSNRKPIQGPLVNHNLIP